MTLPTESPNDTFANITGFYSILPPRSSFADAVIAQDPDFSALMRTFPHDLHLLDPADTLHARRQLAAFPGLRVISVVRGSVDRVMSIQDFVNEHVADEHVDDSPEPTSSGS